MRDEEHLVGDKVVRISVVDTFEIMTVGPSDHDQMQVLSGADVQVVSLVDDEESVALVGEPVLVAEVTGTHSCEEGDARAYWVVTLGDVPAPEGPVTTCEAMAASVTEAGWVVLNGKTETWAWAPGKRWAVLAN
jgi:hypothetical protein